MNETSYTVILKHLRTEMNEVADTILLTELSLDAYRKLQGIIEGYARVERFIQDLEKNEREAG